VDVTDLIDPVGRAMREVAAAVVLPRFRSLAADEVHEKGPGDVVTVADAEAEVRLTEVLGDLLPDAAVVGEEAVAADPSVLDRAREADRAWIIDPIDGTANFVAGSADFAVMVALVEAGVTTASWILQPVADRLFTAVRGDGASLDGRALHRPPAPALLGALRGVARTRFLSPDAAARVADGTGAFAEVGEGRKAAGVEYPRLVLGEIDFVVYLRTLVWDHAPGALLLEEAGGRAVRLDGAAYEPWSDRTGLVLAADPATARRVIEHLAPDGHL